MRVGFGYDVHPLVKGRPLILGGVEVPYSYGLGGHSDADVLLHAISDALLGAMAEGDIGKHFPDTDPKYEGISSKRLLTTVGAKLQEKGFIVSNIDSTLLAEKPRLSDFIPKMVKEIAEALDIETIRVNVKATTSEGLGFVGRGEGIAAFAVVLVGEAK